MVYTNNVIRKPKPIEGERLKYIHVTAMIEMHFFIRLRIYHTLCTLHLFDIFLFKLVTLGN